MLACALCVSVSLSVWVSLYVYWSVFMHMLHVCAICLLVGVCMSAHNYMCWCALVLYKINIGESIIWLSSYKNNFGRISIGNLDKFISYMWLKLQLWVNFNVHVLSNQCDTIHTKLDMEAKPPHKTYTNVVWWRMNDEWILNEWILTNSNFGSLISHSFLYMIIQ